MYISSVRVNNYKSFYESSFLELQPGFNIITGQNNAGKTALLEAMRLQFSSMPHRSLRTVPDSKSHIRNHISSVDIAFTISREELRTIFTNNLHNINVPIPDNASTFRNPDERGEYVERTCTEIFSLDSYTFALRWDTDSGFIITMYPTFGLYAGLRSQNNGEFVSCRFNPETKSVELTGGGNATLNSCDFGFEVAHILRNQIYSFRAERFGIGTSKYGTNRILEPNAGNLPEVLGMLQTNRDNFNEFNERVHAILPSVKWISVKPISDTQQRILVWTVDARREDLAFPLEECGTGIGQVLAILYVVLTSEFPQAILIDEPQSFLHPGAARKLIEMLRLHRQHQFVIATHSPAIITAATPQTITIVRQDNSQSVLESINASESEQLRGYLAEIGARLSDVFGADSIIWVEGPTEERCFPRIIESLAERSLMGTVCRAVRDPGGLTGRNATLIIEIYERLSHARSLLPPTLRFILDDEGRTDQEKKDLQRRSRDLITFLPRRMYENYLLNPSAIAAVANQIEGFREGEVTPKEIQDCLDNERGNESNEAWIPRVDAARLLGDIFTRLSETRVRYDKVRHSVALTEWLIENSPTDLREIANLLLKVLDERREVGGGEISKT